MAEFIKRLPIGLPIGAEQARMYETSLTRGSQEAFNERSRRKSPDIFDRYNSESRPRYQLNMVLTGQMVSIARNSNVCSKAERTCTASSGRVVASNAMSGRSLTRVLGRVRGIVYACNFSAM